MKQIKKKNKVKTRTYETAEDTVSHKMVDALNDMNKKWKVYSQPLGVFKKSNRRPDILIKETGKNNVIIETEIEPKNPELDAKKRLAEKFIGGDKVSAVIGCKLPKKFRYDTDEDIFQLLKQTNDFEFVVFSPIRFPDKGFLKGSLKDIVNIVNTISVPSNRIKDCVNELSNSLSLVSEIINDAPDTIKTNIAKLIKQPENEQTWKIAGLIISNALVFHSRLAGKNNIIPLQKLKVTNILIPNMLMDEWEKILKINYYAIFDVAKNILSEFESDISTEIISKLERTAGLIHALKLSNSSDMYGSLLQEVIYERQTLKSYYTKPESASLLASLSVPSHNDKMYTDKQTLLDKNFIIADFACGTGTLLTSAYKQMIANFEFNGNDMSKIHTDIIGNSIIGCDVLPAATHLTVSALASLFPDKLIKKSRISTMDYGVYTSPYTTTYTSEEKYYRLGSLELINSETTLDPTTAYIGGHGEEVHTNPQISHESCDLIIMNPPFTSNTKSDEDRLAIFSSFGVEKDDQKAMKKITDKKFKGTCKNDYAGAHTHFLAIADKKLKPGGTMAFVLPSTVAYSFAHDKVRELLKLKYNFITIISISGTNNKRSFSSDTNIGEMLLIAKKISKDKLDIIENIEHDIKESYSRIKNNQSIILQRKRKHKSKPSLRQKPVPVLQNEIEKHIDKLKVNRKKIKDTYQDKTIKLVGLHTKPNSTLISMAISNIIKYVDDIKIVDIHDSSQYGGTTIEIGNEVFGHIIQAPAKSKWWFVNVHDPILTQCVYALSNGKLITLDEMGEGVSIPMTTLGENRLGSLTREIIDYFTCSHINSDSTPVHLLLEGVNANTQKCMIVKPDESANPKNNKSIEKINKLLKEKSHVHFNIECRFTSQKLIVMYTKKKALGGTSIPTVAIDEKYKKAFTIWCNSTLGILCFWACAPKQQMGRSKATKKSMIEMPILDFEQLTEKQLKRLDEIFDKYSKKEFIEIKRISSDETRKSMDAEILEALNITDRTIDFIRNRLVKEPSITQNMQDNETTRDDV